MNNKNSNPEIFIEKISDLKQLSRSLIFLKKGFNWSTNYSEKLFNSLSKNNSRINFFGFDLKNRNSELVGSILTLYQGSTYINGKEILIINLSSWYLSELERGFKAIYMMKKVTEQLSEFIITNYSPSRPTESILMAIGFKKCETNTKNFYFFKYFIKIFLAFTLSQKMLSIKSINNEIDFKPVFSDLNFRDSILIDIKFKSQKLNLLIAKSHVEKKVFGFIFKISRLNVLWASNNVFLKNNLEIILPFLFKKYRFPLISFHCLDLIDYDKNKIWRSHYYKSPIKLNIRLPIIGSEYSIGTN